MEKTQKENLEKLTIYYNKKENRDKFISNCKKKTSKYKDWISKAESKVPKKVWKDESKKWNSEGRPSVDETDSDQIELWFKTKLETLEAVLSIFILWLENKKTVSFILLFCLHMLILTKSGYI